MRRFVASRLLYTAFCTEECCNKNRLRATIRRTIGKPLEICDRRGREAPVKSILMHRELPVAVLDINPNNASIDRVYEVLADDHLPLYVRCGPAHIAQNLDRWFPGRAIPAGRMGLRQALEDWAIRCGTELSSGELLIGCRGLNLSDQYWVSPAGAPLDWAGAAVFSRFRTGRKS